MSGLGPPCEMESGPRSSGAGLGVEAGAGPVVLGLRHCPGSEGELHSELESGPGLGHGLALQPVELCWKSVAEWLQV